MTTFDAALPVIGRAPVVLDAAQQAVRDARSGRGAVVLGAPGSGKTTAAIELVAAAILDDGLDPAQVLVLTPARRTATLLRDRLVVRLGAAGEGAGEGAGRALPGPLARSVAAFAFALVTAANRLDGLAEPRLLSGADQDADLGELLDRATLDEVLGELAGPGPAWPEHLGPEVRRLGAFRTELRDAIARLSEHGVGTDWLRARGRERGLDAWAALADLVDEYRQVLGSARPGQLDPAELVRAAVGLVHEPPSGMPDLPRLVVLDDAHDATPSALDLVAALAARGATVVALGDPDVAANTFRGAEPEALAGLPALLGWRDAEPIVLDTVHRHGPTLRALAADVASRIGTARAGMQRRAPAVPLDGAATDGRGAADPRAIPATWGGAIVALDAPTATRERSLIADLLRERHLLDGVPYRRMAVIVRSGRMVPGIVRALAQAEVPVQSTAAGRPLREHPAARALIRHVDVGVGRSPLDGAAATELLLGPLGGIDRVGLRRLRRALRAEELAGEGDRPADILLADALADPARLATIDHRTARRAARLARTLQAIGERHAAGATVDELLWLAWSESHVAEVWQREAAGFGVAAAEANRALDAVVAVFTAAATIVDTVPDATVESFLARVLDSDVGDDLLAPVRSDDAVLVATPAAVTGLEADIVVIAGLTEGVWPNTRVRGTLLGAPLISRLARGLPVDDLDERRLVLDDELRMFLLAATRARRQLVVTATAGDDEQPSALHALVREHAHRDAAARLGIDLDALAADAVATPGSDREQERVRAEAQIEAALQAARPVRARSLRRLVGRLRRELVDAGGVARESDRVEAARALARLAVERVPGANPEQWWGMLAPSTEAPLFDGDEVVSISPSKLEAIETSPLDWFLDTIAPREAGPQTGIGTIVHAAMQHAVDPDLDAIWAEIESRWSELVFDAPWLAEQQRRLARRYAVGVAAYLRDAEQEGRGLVGAEQRFELIVDRARVSGSVDRLEVDGDGAVRVVDLKTGKPLTKQSDIDTHPQLSAYQLAYAEGAFDEVLDRVLDGLPHRPGGARLLYVREGVRGSDYREAAQAPLDEEQREAVRERLRQAVAAVAVARLTGVRTVDRFDFAAVAHRIHRIGPVTGES
ncbi:PD-(D/E)XK nuclease family protein [Microcella frigidaquae]|uniref:DNA 3'-5' helicase n=1 Tax=Microcella frigidaquae TaxID=424758 RepID=A0A840X8T2_9MICO|nr:superfamily I DNA/RNA helicase/RecB family exonuclease [Microcella frigidaquae]NHN44065.1 ATP-dependent helicase [Microcella frigidaquae]